LQTVPKLAAESRLLVEAKQFTVRQRRLVWMKTIL
jgi:hypothetical protein